MGRRDGWIKANSPDTYWLYQTSARSVSGNQQGGQTGKIVKKKKNTREKSAQETEEKIKLNGGIPVAWKKSICKERFESMCKREMS